MPLLLRTRPRLTTDKFGPAAAGFVLTERVGRAMRKPTVESMLSYATGRLGKGWVYGVNSALDETGATLGPLLMALVLVRSAPSAGDTEGSPLSCKAVWADCRFIFRHVCWGSRIKDSDLLDAPYSCSVS